MTDGTDIDAFVMKMLMRAGRGTYTGDPCNGGSEEYFFRCRHYCPTTKALMIFTRDVGDNFCAWHLSISFCNYTGDCEFTPENVTFLPFDMDAANAWVKRLFQGFCRELWIEGPATKQGKERQVWHYRLFVKDDWDTLSNDVPEYFLKNCVRWSDLHQPANA